MEDRFMAYKIRHKKTRLFLGTALTKHVYVPKYRKWKTNLKKRGSLYEEEPTLKQLENWFGNYYDTEGVRQKFNMDDFEIVKA